METEPHRGCSRGRTSAVAAAARGLLLAGPWRGGGASNALLRSPPPVKQKQRRASRERATGMHRALAHRPPRRTLSPASAPRKVELLSAPRSDAPAGPPRESVSLRQNNGPAESLLARVRSKPKARHSRRLGTAGVPSGLFGVPGGGTPLAGGQLKEAKRNRICRHSRQRHPGEERTTFGWCPHDPLIGPCPVRAVLAPFSGHVVRCSPSPSELPSPH